MILPASYANGFAPRDGRPLYPSLWRGCVGAWAPCLGPSGLTLRDWSGFGNHGTLTNMSADSDWVLSGGRYALDFDATNDYVTCGTSAGLAPRHLTLSANIYRTATNAAYQIVAGKNTAGNNYDYIMALSDVDKVAFLINGVGGWYTSTSVVPVNQWTHISATYDGVNVRVFFNGRLELTTAVAGASPNNGGEFVLARNPASSTQYFAGRLDDVRLYSRAASDAEIRMLASRRGIAYEMAPRRRSSSAVQFNRRRRLLVGA